ncbi:MAG: L-seryl-tRNA(Sec) selenium transferase [Planctomycetota bacterium]
MSANPARNGELLRLIPQVDRVLAAPELRALLASHSRVRVIEELRRELDEMRARGLNGALKPSELAESAISGRVGARLATAAIPYYRRVINGTGVILHTGLGRAPLPAVAVDALARLAGNPVRVEIDLDSGERGGRDQGCAELLCELTRAAAATVVNNNAGATLLLLAALARGKDVILSRGELVEIGGSYRVPEIMAESGARLIEVGTTNRTHLRDYERALTDTTGMILKVHTSNYRIEGFTNEVGIAELAALGRRAQVPVVHDLGSGCLLDLAARGIEGEPLVSDSLRHGADLVCFSGDKLLGGPQSGIILGDAALVNRIRQHPLFRALRPCRLTYIALEAVLRIYRDGEARAAEEIPALARLLATPAELQRRAEALTRALDGIAGLSATVVEHFSMAGSGSLPARDIPTFAVRLEAAACPESELAHKLRMGAPPILCRVRDGALLLDLRTLADAEFALIAASLRTALGS